MSFGRYFGRLGDPPAYTASGVHFNGASYLTKASLTSVDTNNDFSFVFWANTDPTNYGVGAIFFGDYTVAGGGPTVYPAGSFVLGVNAKNTDATKSLLINTATGTFPSAWTCIIGSLNTTTAAIKVYAGDIDITSPLLTNNTPFNIVTNGKSFAIGYDGSPGDEYLGDMADLRIMCGQSLLSGGDIPLSTRRLFINSQGKPVNPNVASAALGLPTMLFSGPAAQFGINQGTGGAFTTVGTLTNASTHP